MKNFLLKVNRHAPAEYVDGEVGYIPYFNYSTYALLNQFCRFLVIQE
jgi:hypothetical protein